MAEKRDWNAQLNSKGLEQSVSEEQARAMCLHQGSTHLFIVQAHAGPKVVNEDGSEKVNLIPDLVELVPEEHAERIRVFQRALYLARPDQFGQEAFEAATAGDVPLESAAAAVDAAVETDESGEPTGIWEPDAEAECPAPDCNLAEGHDGDHQSENQDEAGGSVVEFSGKGQKAQA